MTKHPVYFLIGFLLLFGALPGISQEDILRACKIETSVNTDLSELIRENNTMLDQFRSEQFLKNRSDTYIPLVFHFVLESGRDSFSKAEIMSQIEILNECFSGQNADRSGMPANFREFTNNQFGPLFCLARRTVNGITEAGINYKFVQESNFGDLKNPEGKPIIKYEQLGGLDAWDPERFVNIWVGDLEYIQATATLPNSVPAAELGILIDPDYFGIYDKDAPQYPFHLGKTLVHELGHFFNLLHLWGSEPDCDSDDGIEDTPLQEFIYTGCPSGEKISCGTADMYMNFMNFTDDECLLFFTQQQRDRMLQSIDAFYPKILEAGNCYFENNTVNVLENIQIKYNPNAGTIRLELPGPTCDKIQFSLMQMDGKLLMQQNLFCEYLEEIDLNLMPVGIYILFLRTDDNFILRKLFVY